MLHCLCGIVLFRSFTLATGTAHFSLLCTTCILSPPSYPMSVQAQTIPFVFPLTVAPSSACSHQICLLLIVLQYSSLFILYITRFTCILPAFFIIDKPLCSQSQQWNLILLFIHFYLTKDMHSEGQFYFRSILFTNFMMCAVTTHRQVATTVFIYKLRLDKRRVNINYNNKSTVDFLRLSYQGT